MSIAKAPFRVSTCKDFPELNLENVQLEHIQMDADYGLICVDATGVKIKDLSIKTKKFPVMDIRNTKNFSIDGLKTPSNAGTIIRTCLVH